MTRVLFLAHNRRGLGHLMRGLNIARAVRELCPGAEVRFFARSASAETMCGDEFPCSVDTSDEWQAGWARAVRIFAPDVAVFDTLLPAEAPETARATVYVMRRCKPDRQAQIFASPFMDKVDRIIIPHTPEEFGHELPRRLSARSRFVGPIVRPLDPATQARLRARYELAEDEAPVLSTAGGGGFADDAESFFAIVAATHARLLERRPDVRHIVVRGPHFGGTLPSLPGLTVVDHEPELGNLFALAGLVIAEGGYNTVQELRLARAAAVFLPGERSYDDQEERVRALEAQGAAAVFTSRDPELLAPRIAELAASPERLRAMRAAHGASLVTGNRAAAAAIVDLVRGRP
jgi:predicted glycosyltransferase